MTGSLPQQGASSGSQEGVGGGNQAGTAASASQPSAERQELEGLQNRLRGSGTARSGSTVATRGSDSHRRSQGLLPPKSAKAQPMAILGVAGSSDLSRRHQELAGMLEQAEGEVGAARASSSRMQVPSGAGSAVPRLAAQYVGDDPGQVGPSQAQRPQTPPPRAEEDTELVTEMAKLTPNTKSRVWSMIKGKAKRVVSPGTRARRDRDADEAEVAFYGHGAVDDSDDDEGQSNPYKSKLDPRVARGFPTSQAQARHEVSTAAAESSSSIAHKRHQQSPQFAPSAKKSRYEHDDQRSVAQQVSQQPQEQRRAQQQQGQHQQQYQEQHEQGRLLRPDQRKRAWIEGSSASSAVPVVHPSVTNKLANSQYVPLWHFTSEGIDKGYSKALKAKDFGDTVSSFLDAAGKAAELATTERKDSQLSFTEMYQAVKVWGNTMKDILDAETDEERYYILEDDYLGWCKQFDLVFDHGVLKEDPEAWSYVAKYVEDLRKKYFAKEIGFRIDPTFIHDDIFIPLKTKYEAAKAFAPVKQALQQQLDKLSGVAGSSFGGGGHRQGQHGGGGPGSGSSSSHQPKKPKPQQGMVGKPFLQGTESKPTRSGACVICGAREVGHDYQYCCDKPI
ncbi:hypothetical protein OC835_007370, partial [Tilletia horrida]